MLPVKGLVSRNSGDDEGNSVDDQQGSRQPRHRVESPLLVTSGSTSQTVRTPIPGASLSTRRPAAAASSSSSARKTSAKQEATPSRDSRSSLSKDEASLWRELPSLTTRPSVRSEQASSAALQSRTSKALLVVAIDLGTTYSGFAFSLKSDFEEDPLRVHCLNIRSQGRKFQAAKVPTAILFNPEKEFDSFGYEAEEKYARMTRWDATKWFMFDRFKMELHSKTTLSRDTVLLDKSKKKSMKALNVLSAAIRHLKDHALRVLLQLLELYESHVTWVLTVPAIWDDGAKQFMREAAVKAGLDNSRLELALEPEAASIYCLHYFQANPGSVSLSSKGARFLTVDCGGSTVELSVFEVGDGPRLRQLHKPEGAPCGGTLVDKAFNDLLMKVLGFDGLTAVDNLEHLHLMREFENAKRIINISMKIAIKIPPTMKEQLQVTLSDSRTENDLSMVKDKLMVSGKALKELFTNSITGIVAAIEKVLHSPEVGHVNAIVLVGGFSESEVIQDAVKAAFPKVLVIVPPSPSCAKVIGAVQFGHNPNVIAASMTTFTYGIEETRRPCQKVQSPFLVASGSASQTVRTPRQKASSSTRPPAATAPSSSAARIRSAKQEATPSRDSRSSLSKDEASLWRELSSLTTHLSVSSEQASPTALQSRTFKSPLVVAIDFGTTYSGIAFSLKSDFEKNPLRVHCVNILSQDQKSQAAKVPTAILFNPDQEFDSFGYEAEEKYAKMEREDATKWFMFDRFKMKLHSKTTLIRDMDLLDKTRRKSMKAFDVFSAAIRHLKDHALRQLPQLQTEQAVQESDVTWVLTVPAIWDDGAKQFMREAAVKAGLDNSRLELALEPEAASIYCLHYFQANPGSVSLSSKGARFLTVDCGGGTVDLSVFEVGYDSRLRQLHKPEGAPCGGTLVDKAFKDLLIKVLGFDGLTAVDNLEHLHLMREFEKVKENIGVGKKIAINFPRTMKEELRVTLKDTGPEDELSIVKDKLMLSGKAAETFFKDSVTGIMAAIETVLNSPEVGHVNAILLVGGFSESKVIQDKVKAAFPNDLFLVPSSPSLTVMMGAVQFGHNPNLIATRIAAFTYGIEVEENFLEGYHDPSKKKVIGGQECCTGVFDAVIKVNDRVALDQKLPFHTISPAEPGQKVMHLKVYRSPQPQPMYVTDQDCVRIGSVTVKMPDLKGDRNRQVQVTMSVSGTELQVMARDQNTKREYSTSCDLLS